MHYCKRLEFHFGATPASTLTKKGFWAFSTILQKVARGEIRKKTLLTHATALCLSFVSGLCLIFILHVFFFPFLSSPFNPNKRGTGPEGKGKGREVKNKSTYLKIYDSIH